jgi:hypothetical protein
MTTKTIKTTLIAQARERGVLGCAQWSNGTVRAIAEPVMGRSTTRHTYRVRWTLNGNRCTEQAAANFLR